MSKTFNRNGLTIMSLGNIIGSGLFLGSSAVIESAGPAAVFAYLIGGVIMAIEVMFITEMSVINPAPGAFKVHTTEIFGPWAGFVNGWMFWFSGILGMASEVAAAATFSSYWFPNIPLWVFCIFFAAIMAVINLNDLKGLSRIESILASVKIIALIAFIVLGFLILSNVIHFDSQKLANPFVSQRTLMPNGFKGIFAAMIMVMFSYTGTGIIGLAIADTEKPEKHAPSAIAVISGTVLIIYTLSTLFIILLSQWTSVSTAESPFVMVLNKLRIPYSGSILNFIVLTAALSGLNSAMYSSTRMMRSMSKDGQAPKVFLKTSKRGVPVYALMLSSTALLLTAVLSYFIPSGIFIILATSSGFLALINWLTITATHYFYRKRTLKKNPEKLKFKVPLYPYINIIEAILIVLIIASSPLYPGQISGLIGGLVLLFILIIIYFILRFFKKLK